MLKRIVTNLLRLSIGVTLVFAPLYVVRCSSFSWCSSPIPFTLLEILILITILIWLLSKTISQSSLTQSLEKIPPIFKILFFIFFLSGLLAVLTASDKITALGALKAYFIEPMLFAYICFDYLQQETKSKLILISLAFSVIWLGVLSLLEYLFHFSLANQEEYLLRGRISGVYLSSNALSLFLGPIIFIILGKLFEFAKQKNQNLSVTYLLIVAIFASIIGVFLSGSRGGIFGVFCGLILFLILKYSFEKNNRKIIIVFQRIVRYFFPILTIFCLIILFNIGNIAELRGEKKIFADLNPRICLWEGSVNIIKNKPIFGSGLSGFQEVYKNYQTCSKEVINYPHNIFLNFWTEIGIIGLISFLGIILLITNKLLNLDKISLTTIGIVCSFSVIMLHGLVDVPYFKNDLSLVFWVLIALAMFELDYQSFTVKHRSLRQIRQR